MQANLKLCPLCGRVDNGAARCRDHSEPPKGKRLFAQLAKEGSQDA